MGYLRESVGAEMIDWRGTPITPGSIIVYPGRQSSSMWMVEAEVLEVYQQDQWGDLIWTLKVQPIRAGSFGRTNKKPVKITALERVTVIQQGAMEVIGEPIH